MKKKARGTIRLTTEKLEALLELPKEVQITNVSFDSTRNVVTLSLLSEKDTACTQTLSEAMMAVEFTLEK